ncbi:uncharacterized protein LOC129219141 [Uloborus diversus]|uniref:uncharacterized protein LOC129219141 n=1 Tax=Uloborus diversus TaxID=327109 RepID=UPI002409255D|nr:uncharacterized protein LOC129219141 [Uloborus diversus]
MGRLVCLVCLCLIALRALADQRPLCDTLCKGLRFPGRLGGCNCHFVLFNKRDLSRSIETGVETMRQLRHKLFRQVESGDSLENETEDEYLQEKPRRHSFPGRISTSSLERKLWTLEASL